MGNQFHLACWRGDVEKVEAWININIYNPFYTKRDVFGAHALHIAVYRGYLDIITLLINSYIPVNELSYCNVIDPLMKEVIEHTQGDKDIIIQYLQWLCISSEWYRFGLFPPNRSLHELAQQNEPFIGLFQLVRDPNCEQFLCSRITLLENGLNSPLPGCPSHITPLRLAVIAKRVQFVKYLLSRGANHTITDGIGNTVLHIAALMGTVDVVQCLLDAGCSLSAVNEESFTPFCSAALCGSLPIITAMIKSQQFFSSNVKLEFAMGIIVVENHFHIMSSLVRLGMNVSTVHIKDSYPLIHLASFCRNLSTVTKLLEYGVDATDSSESMQQTALHYAAISGATDVIRPLISAGLSINEKDSHGFTAGDVAVFYSGMSFLSALIEFGYDVNQTMFRFYDGNYLHFIICLMNTFLSKTLYKPTVHHLRALVSMGCDMHLADKFGRLPIHAAAILNRGDAITCLVDCGCAVDVLDSSTNFKERMRPIHFAALYDSVKAIESLSRLDANLNASCSERKLLPIHLAILSRSFKACFKLLELGASPIVSQFDGLTPMHLAALHTSTELIDALADCGCSVNISSDEDSEVVPKWYRPLHPFDPSLCSHAFKPIHIAVAVKNVIALRKLLTLGAEVDAVCLNATPLHLASAIGFTEGVDVLLDFKANADQPGPGGFTPLHLAALYGHVEVVELLISSSCDVCYQTPEENGRGHLTALHLASLACQSCVVEMLLEATQTDINQLTSDGMSPLHLALLPVDLKIKTVGEVPDRRICLSGSELEFYHGVQTATVSLLMTKGCNVNTLTVFGHSPYDFAIIYSLDHIVPLLKTAGAVSGTELKVKKRLAEIEKSRKFVQDQVDAKEMMEVMYEKIKKVEDECSKRHRDVEAEKEGIAELKEYVNQYIAVQPNLDTRSVKDFLQQFCDQFLVHAGAKEIASILRRKCVIPESLETRIGKSDDSESANGLLYDHLSAHGNFNCLEIVCSTLKSFGSKGYPAMADLGKAMKEKLACTPHHSQTVN